MINEKYNRIMDGGSPEKGKLAIKSESPKSPRCLKPLDYTFMCLTSFSGKRVMWLTNPSAAHCFLKVAFPPNIFLIESKLQMGIVALKMSFRQKVWHR